jgi:hypothetical protein
MYNVGFDRFTESFSNGAYGGLSRVFSADELPKVSDSIFFLQYHGDDRPSRHSLAHLRIKRAVFVHLMKCSSSFGIELGKPHGSEAETGLFYHADDRPHVMPCTASGLMMEKVILPAIAC